MAGTFSLSEPTIDPLVKWGQQQHLREGVTTDWDARITDLMELSFN